MRLWKQEPSLEQARRADRARLVEQRRERRRVVASLGSELSRDRRQVKVLRADEARLARLVRELERSLVNAEKLASIGMLAAGVAHEVNTPLAVISSYAQLLQKQLQGDDKRTSLLDKITRQTFRASEIVNSLLNFSRTSGSEFAEVDLNKIIHETLALLEHQFKTTQVKVQEDLLPALPPIHGNAGKLQQVFLNLFLNAKDAMASGGMLRVATQNGDGVRVMIADTGSGIAQEHIQRIYDPFFTTKNGGRDGRKGTGLGLSVTYGIIQEHAGKIQVESHVGQGTTFYLEFPLMRKAVNV